MDDLSNARFRQLCTETHRENRIEASREFDDDGVLILKRLFDGDFVGSAGENGNRADTENANTTSRDTDAQRQRPCGERVYLPLLISIARMHHQQ